jgi:GDP-mannose 6-dehydrogenase
MQKIAVFGLGYVGCVTAACLGQDGHDVVGVDVDAAKVSEINSGLSPISEPGLDDVVATQVKAGRLRATTSVAEAVGMSEMALIAVGTPSAEDGSVTIGGVEMVVRSIATALRENPKPYRVVVRSTLLPGILEEKLSPALFDELGSSAADDVSLFNNPEFLRESTAIKDYYNPPYILVGTVDDVDATPVMEMYHAVENTERIVTDTRTAALVKYACNAFHAVKVAFANEIGTMARVFGANGHEVMNLVCKDRKLNISTAYMRPGFAFGGSCLPKDLRALTRSAEQSAVPVNLLSAVLPSNESQLKRGLKLIRETRCRKIGIIGLSFKAGTDDLRESPMVELVETLLGWGLEVKIYDPYVMLSRLRGRNLAYIDRHLPHLAQLLAPQLASVLSHAEMLVVTSDVAEGLDLNRVFAGKIIDLRKDLALPASSADSTAGGIPSGQGVPREAAIPIG